jgi:YidC/Oxa1 family membrane protein insertase
MNIFTVIFYQPLLNLLVWIHNLLPGNDLGWSIIALTVVIKIILHPLSAKSLKSQKALQEIQPKVDALKEKHKGDKETMGRAMMDLYKQEKVSPFSSCLPILVQLPFLIAIYRVLRDGLKDGGLTKLYPFVARPEAVSTVWLGIVDLTKASIPLAIATGIIQFWQTRMLTHRRQPLVPGSQDEGMSSMMNKQMMYFMPIVTIVIGATLPGGLTLYWFTNTLVTLAEQVFVLRRHKPNTSSPK